MVLLVDEAALFMELVPLMVDVVVLVDEAAVLGELVLLVDSAVVPPMMTTVEVAVGVLDVPVALLVLEPATPDVVELVLELPEVAAVVAEMVVEIPEEAAVVAVPVLLVVVAVLALFMAELVGLLLEPLPTTVVVELAV